MWFHFKTLEINFTVITQRQKLTNSTQVKLCLRVIFTLYLLCFFSPCAAVVPAFKHIGREDGLKNESIKAIIQDRDGYMWFGTVSGLFKYDGYQFKRIILDQNLENIDVLSLFVDSTGLIWIGTKSQGLFTYNNDTAKSHKVHRHQPRKSDFRVYDIIEDKNQQLWLGSSDGLGLISLNSDGSDVVAINKNYLPTLTVYALSFFNDEILIGSNNALLRFNGINGEFAELHRFPKEQQIHKFLVDVQKKLWIGTSKGLIKFDVENAMIVKSHELNINNRVLSMVSEGDHLWVASLFSGLYRINISDHSSLNFIYQPEYVHTLSENNITELYISSDRVLWAGTFTDGLNKLYLDTLNFGFETNISGSFDCADNHQVYGINKDNDSLWIGTGAGLIHYDDKRHCKLYPMNPHNDFDNDRVYHSWTEDNALWVSTSSGFKQLNKKTAEIKHIDTPEPKITLFSFRHTDQVIYVGTLEGLYSYSTESQSLSKVKSTNTMLDRAIFQAYALDNNGTPYFATSHGLAQLRGNLLSFSDFVPAQFNGQSLLGIFIDSDNTFYLGYDSQGLIHIDPLNLSIVHFNGEHGFSNGMTIKSIIADQFDHTLWMGTDLGLIQYHIPSKSAQLYDTNDGINGHLFFTGSVSSDDQGQLYFGHNDGFISFNPKQIKNAEAPKYLTLTDFYLLNNRFNPNQSHKSGLTLTQSINAIDQLKLGHKQNMIGFEFSSMQYHDPRKNKFAYRITGLSDQWHEIGYDQRHLTFSNLYPGNYQLQIKAANKDGLWSKKIKKLDIKVSPAPWQSPLAYLIYVLLIIASIILLIRHRTASARLRAEQLESEVIKRTHEVKIQKQMVESMLNHKNQLYTNITHEFRTPLALITGPIDNIINKAEAEPLSDELNMVKRNADQLLLMVDQLLNLSETEHKQPLSKHVQAVKPQLTMLHASFSTLANEKDIEFNCGPLHDIDIMATPQCLEIVVGNLISNAIKYTQIGGKINLFTELHHKKINIVIQDNGPGISDEHQNIIFDRFTRLHDEHIQGSGIGLAVVKEITTINDGNVQLANTPENGCTFIISFKCYQSDSSENEIGHFTDQLPNNNKALPNTHNPMNPPSNSTMPILLIIEDNLDMQTYIGKVLGQRFNCIFADNGKQGITLCLKNIPDVVICDVMMPGMDGFQVAKTIRDDNRTSHIPIILLTALKSRESRIRGWREKIDVFISKPFDASELIARLENILQIRQILQQQTNNCIQNSNGLSKIDLHDNDKIFIQDLKSVIKEHYSNKNFYKAQMAHEMAVSERQLNRKTKALIGQNPMDLLREYRLTSAAEKLISGLQVSLVSESCGFNDTSYFAACFKRRYQLTPKKYQLLHKQDHPEI